MLPGMLREQAERIRQAVFGQHSDWARGWIVDAQHRLAADIEDCGLQDRLRYLYQSQRQSNVAEAEPFEAFVVGEVKFGKSTLINALLGTEIAPTDFVPKTWCFNRYIAVDEPASGVLVLAEPEELPKSPDLADLLGPSIGESRGLSMHRISREEADRLLDMEEAKTLAALASPTPYVSPVLEMEWQVKSSKSILPGIRLVDTMGMNGMKERKGHLRYLTWQYARADAVLWVVSAKNLNSAGTREELESCRRYAKRIILVVNRWDEVDDRERLAETAKQLYGEFATEIVYLSALAASIGVSETPVDSLPGKQRGPLRAFMEREGIDGFEQLRDKSGYPSLQRALEAQLSGRLTLVRNEASYSALRRQQKEFRLIVQRDSADLSANLAVQDHLHETLGKLDGECRQSIEGHMVRLRDAMDRRLRSAVASLGYEDSEHPEVKVSMPLLLNIARVEQQKVTEELVGRYRDLVSQVAQEPDYVQSEFTADGRVAETVHAKTLGLVDLVVKPLEIDSLLASVDRGLLLKAYDKMEAVPVIGGLAKGLVGGAAERKRAEALMGLQKRILAEVEPRVHNLVEKIAEHLQESRAKTTQNVADEIRRHAETFGSREAQEARAEHLTRYASRKAEPPIWVGRTLQALREKGWKPSK